MEPREAFKIGFLSRCVEEGLSQVKTAELIEKAAELQGIVDAGKAVMYPAAALALAAPPTLGGLAAYFNNKVTDTSDSGDVEEIKQKELKETYRRLAQELRDTKNIRKRKSESKRSRQVFL